MRSLPTLPSKLLIENRLESVMSRFSEQIRELAAKDKLISSRGVSGYVQAVLVRELAVLMIQEDMGCGAQRARDILKESIGIGDLLNEEEEEELRHVTEREEDDDDDVLNDR